MGQVAFTVRMDTDVKRRFDELCKDFGMSANTAFNVFAKAVIRQERIPFDLESENQAVLNRARQAIERMRNAAAENGLSEMTMQEIDEEIMKVRKGV